jgi:hypothetical protein
MTEKVNHPKHYNSNPSGVECITVVEHMNFNIGNAIRYLWRSGFKKCYDDDLNKAIWYIKREQRLRARMKLLKEREAIAKRAK